jgi:hypothetical protein
MPEHATQEVDEDHDPEREWAAQKARALSGVAIVVGWPFGIAGVGRIPGVASELAAGAPLDRAILALAVRPLPLDLYGVGLAVQLVFLGWQIVMFRRRAALLLVPGLLAALMTVVHIVANHTLFSGECACEPPRIPFWVFLLITLAIAAANSWLLGKLAARLVPPRPLPWERARLAAFAWTNGGLMLLTAQLGFLYWRFGSAAFA